MFNHKQATYYINTLKYLIHTKPEIIKPRCLTISKPEKINLLTRSKLAIVNCLVDETRSDLHS